MRKIFGEAQYKIYEKISKDRHYYRKLLETLVTQVNFLFYFLFPPNFPHILLKKKTQKGLIKLWEKKVVIQCLERDVSDLESVLEGAKKKFTDLVMKEMNIKFEVSIELNKKNFLTPREPHDHSRDTVRTYDVVEEETINKNEEDRKW